MKTNNNPYFAIEPHEEEKPVGGEKLDHPGPERKEVIVKDIAVRLREPLLPKPELLLSAGQEKRKLDIELEKGDVLFGKPLAGKERQRAVHIEADIFQMPRREGMGIGPRIAFIPMVQGLGDMDHPPGPGRDGDEGHVLSHGVAFGEADALEQAGADEFVPYVEFGRSGEIAFPDKGLPVGEGRVRNAMFDRLAENKIRNLIFDAVKSALLK